MNYKQRDIILVLFPFTDLSTTKQRPALIISTDEFNKNEDIVVLAITSKQKLQQFAITISNTDLEENTLPKPSKILCNKIYTLSKTIVRKKLAILKEQAFFKVIQNFEKVYKKQS